MISKRSKTAFFVLLGILALQGCSLLSSSKNLPIDIKKRQAIELAKEFAVAQGFSDEFNLKKASKIERQRAIAKPPYWVWQVFFAAKNESALKFYKKTYLLVEVNAADGKIGEWGRR